MEIEITVYGMHPASYEAVTRAPDSFAQFWRGVSLLLARKVAFIVRGALLPQNKHELEEFESWAKTIPSMTGRPSYSMFFELRSRRDSEDRNRLIEYVRVSPKEGLALSFRDETTHRQWTPELASKHLRPLGARLFNCDAAKGQSPCVDAYGRMQPCMPLRAPALTHDVLGPSGHSALRVALDQFADLREQRATNPEVPAAVRGLLSQARVRAVPGQVVDGTWHARYSGRVPVRGHSLARNPPGLAGRP